MNNKPYLDQHRIIAIEDYSDGFKRVWVEIQQDESLMIKIKGDSTEEEIHSICAAKLQELKDIQTLQEEQRYLEAQLELIKAQLMQS